MSVQIKIDQTGAPAGVAGKAREDLVLGVPVTLTAVGGPFLRYEWTLVDAPTNELVQVLSSAALSSPLTSVTSVTPIDYEGTYAIQLKVDSGLGLGARGSDTAKLTFAAFDSNNAISEDGRELPQRVPSFLERTEHNVNDDLEPLGNTKGWSRTLRRWFEIVRRIYRGKFWAWANIQVTGGAASIYAPAGPNTQAFNVASVTYIGVGAYDVTFTENFYIGAGVKYSVIAFPQHLPFGAPAIAAFDETLSTSGHARINTFDLLGNPIDCSFVVVFLYSNVIG